MLARCRISGCAFRAKGGTTQAVGRAATVRVVAHRVEIVHEGKTHIIEVKPTENILEVALRKGINLPHDCTLGVCMTVSKHTATGSVGCYESSVLSRLLPSIPSSAKIPVLCCSAQQKW